MSNTDRQAEDSGRRCTRCRTVYPPDLVERAFRAPRQRVCRKCEGRERQQRRNPYLVKAHDVIRRHAERRRIDKDRLIKICGWDPRTLAQDAEHQYRGRCSYCRKPYVGMGNGLADLTLDILDPTRLPYYCTNTKWCCRDCNRNKGAMSPAEFEEHRQISELWMLPKDEPPEQGMLFDVG